MYIPDISASVTCGFNYPYMTERNRQNGSTFSKLLQNMNCLYLREFRPLYIENGCGCSDISGSQICYSDSMWGFITKHSTQLNKKNIWNDIIKRWEPSEFDQILDENIDSVKDYEFRKYEDVYGIAIDDSCLGSCGSCNPMIENNYEGIGFVKSTTDFSSTETTDGCCICNLLNNSMYMRHEVLENIWVSKGVGNIRDFAFNPDFGPELNKQNRVSFGIYNKYWYDIIQCGDTGWKLLDMDFSLLDDTITYRNYKGYIEFTTNIQVTVDYPIKSDNGIITFKYVDIYDPTHIMECKYEWGYRWGYSC